MDRIHNLLNDISSFVSAQKTYDGKKRSDLKDSDFLFPETKSFPIVTPADVKDAISNFGRMKNNINYDSFLKKLYNFCKRKGPAFVAALPEASKEKLGIKKSRADHFIHMDRFSVGDTVKNINTACMHYGSVGVVEDIEALPHNMGNVIVYRTTNTGPTWEKDDLLKKTPSQLIKANIQMQQHREPSMIDDQTDTNDIVSENIDEPTVINQPTNINEPMDNADDETMDSPDIQNDDQVEFVEMAMSILKGLIYKAQTIMNHADLPSVKENLTEPWLLGKIAVMDDYMSTVHDFVMFSTDTDDTESDAGERPGLWDNIRRKKEREGKNYKPAKPGDKDRPDPEQWKKLTK